MKLKKSNKCKIHILVSNSKPTMQCISTTCPLYTHSALSMWVVSLPWLFQKTFT